MMKMHPQTLLPIEETGKTPCDRACLPKPSSVHKVPRPGSYRWNSHAEKLPHLNWIPLLITESKSQLILPKAWPTAKHHGKFKVWRSIPTYLSAFKTAWFFQPLLSSLLSLFQRSPLPQTQGFLLSSWKVNVACAYFLPFPVCSLISHVISDLLQLCPQREVASRTSVNCKFSLPRKPFLAILNYYSQVN